MKKYTLIIILPLLVFISCRKDIAEVLVEVNEDPPIVLIESSIRGKVVNETGLAVPFSIVSIENSSTQTDADGFFHLKNIEVKKSGGIIKAQNQAYFDGISHSNFTAEGSSFIEIRMIEKPNAISIDASTAAAFTSNDGLNIEIPSGSLVTSNGTAYTGTANVFPKWLDPTDENLGGIMPGALTAKDENGDPLVLASFGMLALELEAPNGAPLDIKEGRAITVEIPIPDELLNDAPDEIPLWYFDLDEEQWVLSGACNKEGGKYVCTIKKTGYWNCDIQLPAICLSGQFFNSDSTFSAYLKVTVEDLTDNFIYWGYTDSLGYFCGSVPQAALLRITVTDHCDNIVYTDDIGPYSQDFDLGIIYLEETVEEFIINLTGTVQDCAMADAAGHIAIRYPGKIRIYPFSNGIFDIDMGLKCLEFPLLEITAYNANAAESSLLTEHSTFADLDLGSQVTCEPLDDFFNLTVDGTDEYWTAPTQFYLKPNTTSNWMVLEGLSGAGKFILDLRDYTGVGQYSANVFFNVENDTPLPNFQILTTSSPDINLEITGDDGEYIEGNFTGTALDINSMVHTVDASFRVRKAP